MTSNPRRRSPDRSLPEVVDHLSDAVPVKRRWRRQGTEGHLRGRHSGPTTVGGCYVSLPDPRRRGGPLTAGVSQLDARPGTLFLNETDDRLPCLDVLVGP